MDNLFEVTNQIKKIKVDPQKLIKLCQDYNKSLDYVTFDCDKNKYGVINLFFKTQYTDDELLNITTMLTIQSEVSSVKNTHFSNRDGNMITMVEVRFDGVIDNHWCIYV